MPGSNVLEQEIEHVARLLARGEVVESTVARVAGAVAGEGRLLVVHSGSRDGSALNLALEEVGISLQLQSGSVELCHDAGSSEVLAEAAGRILRYGDGPLRVLNLTADSAVGGRPELCVPVEGLSQLIELECLFSVEEPTTRVISQILQHDVVFVDETRMSLSDSTGKMAVLAALLGAAQRTSIVTRVVSHEGFADLGVAVLGQVEAVHLERIKQRKELTALRDQLVIEGRELQAALTDQDQRVEIDRRIMTCGGDVDALLALASGELEAGLILEDQAFELLRSSERPSPLPLCSLLLEKRLDSIARDLEDGVPKLVRLGRPEDGSRLVMRLAKDRRLGYLSIVVEGVRGSDLQGLWLDRLRASVAAARQVEVEMSEMVGRVGRHILRELVAGGLSTVESASAASQLGWMEGRGAALVVLTLTGDSDREAELNALCDRLNGGPFVAVVVSDEVVVLCLSSADLQALEGLAATRGAIMGIGSLNDRPELANQARIQASWAARLAKANRQTSLNFDEIGIHRLLLPGSEGGDPEFEAPLQRLEERVDSVAFDPIETLRAYLDCGASAREAAAVLHLHVNTLRYRLRRISALSGLDLDDPESRFRADLALRLRAARRAFGEQN